ncbi:hypothetical protein [Cohnella terricola]|uniref:Adenylate/guanylate cyclase domain-containing protein n=1 Tax=Cohnella terricola TaxID=1289167 RepID=A0A559JQ23_9BACL|nr:hypothetical protein [Cohnella terricola]TVY01958.1 hypothetical protein FPZ45_05800 [Cohnella terricola]
MQQSDSVRTTYENLMEKTKQIVQQKTGKSDPNPTEEQYAVLHLKVEAEGGRDGAKDLSSAQIGVTRLLAVIAQIVSGWGGTLIEANHQFYTAIFPMSEPDAASRSCICGLQIIRAIDDVVNPSLIEEGIHLRFQGGVGISMGQVYGFQTGLTMPVDSLYYGDAMASAVEYANMTSGFVIVDKVVKEHFERSDSEFKAEFVPYRYHEWVGYRFHVN